MVKRFASFFQYSFGTVIGFILIFTALCNPQDVQAQRLGHFYLAPQFGTMYYNGELKDNGAPDTDYMHLFWGAGVRYKVKNIATFGITYQQGRISGADSLGDSNPERDFHFKSFTKEFALTAKVNFINFNKERLNPEQIIWRYGVVVGLGYLNYKPRVLSEDGWLDARKLGTEGQNVPDNSDYPDPYKNWTVTAKLGTELTFELSRRVDLDIFTIYNFAFTDYLDDVGGKYPDPTDLLATPQGALALEYTARYDSGEYPNVGNFRANPDTKDGYLMSGIGLSIRFTDESRKKGNGQRYRVRAKRARF